MTRYQKCPDSNRLVYLSTHDISTISGPSINEREYILTALQQFKNNAIFFLPTPSRSFEALFNDSRVCFKGNPTKFKFIRWIKQQIWIYAALTKLGLSETDLVYTRVSKNLPIGLFLVLLDQKVKFKLVLRHFSARGIDNSKENIVRWFYQRLNTYLIKYITYKASLIETCTPEHKNNAIKKIKIPAAKIYVSTNGVNLSRILPRRQNAYEKDIKIGYIGGSPNTRGGNHVLRLVKAMQANGISAHGVILGGTQDDVDNLTDISKKMGVQKYVKIKKAVPYEEVFKWLSILDVGIALNDAASLKEVGNANQKLRQYLAAGLFIISDPTQKWLEREKVGIAVSSSEPEIDFCFLGNQIYNSLKNREEIQSKSRKIAEKKFCLLRINQQRVDIWRNKIGWQGKIIAKMNDA